MKKFFAVILFLAFGSTVFAQLNRSTPPQPGPAPKINFSNYEKFELENGLKVFVVENNKLPIVSFSLMLDRDPIVEGENAGYISMAGDLMRTGTKSKTKDQLDEEIDFIGATISTSSTGVYASSLKKHSDKLVEIISDIILNAEFRQNELDKIKKQTLSNLQYAKDEPGAIAGRMTSVLYFGKGHPYAEFETEESVENITLDLCKQYYQEYFKPNIAYLAIVGDINKSEAEKLVKKYFENWQKSEVKKFNYETPELPEGNVVAIVDRPNAVQSTIRVGHPALLKIGAPDVIPSNLANTVLGGGVFRLFENLREKHAYTYGAYSNLSSDELIGSFTAFADVKNAVTDSAVSEIIYEMKRIRDEKIPEKELQKAKNYTNGNFAISLEKPETIARFAINIERYNLPENYYSDYLKKVATASADEIQQMAQKYIRPENSYIIIVGNASEVADKMKKFSANNEVKFYDIYANEIDPAANAAPEGVNADDIINKYLDAIGGREKINSIKDIAVESNGSMQGMTFTMKMNRVEPDKFYQEIQIGGMTQKTIMNGDKAVSISPMGNQQITGEDLTKLKYDSDVNSTAHLEKYDIKTKVTGKEKINGKDAYKVELTMPSGEKRYDFYDVENGLKVREAKTITSPGGSFEQITDLLDYKEFGGVKFATKMVQTMGPQKFEFDITSVKINNGVNPSIFEIK